MTPLEAARTYHRWRLAVLPLQRGHKAPRREGWREFRVRDEAQLERLFGRAPVNIGVMLGAPSGGTVDVDLDCGEAIEMAPQFLPMTRTFGRASKRASHWIYRTSEGPRGPRLVSTSQFRDPITQATLCELRGDGCQTVFPSSVHPSGEVIEWTDGETPFATVDGAELRAAVGRLAADVLLSRHPNPSPVVLTAAARWRGEQAPAPGARQKERAPGSVALDAKERARRYLARMDAAVEGQGGNAQTYRVTCILVRKFNLGEADAYTLLSEYNARCKPPWSEAGLRQKLASALAQSAA